MNRRFTPQEVTQAKIGSRAALSNLKYLQRQRVNYTTPARGHMPFDGHRTCAEVALDQRLGHSLREAR